MFKGAIALVGRSSMYIYANLYFYKGNFKDET